MSKQECTKKVMDKINKREKKLKLCRLINLISSTTMLFIVSAFIALFVLKINTVINISILIALFILVLATRIIARNCISVIEEGLMIR